MKLKLILSSVLALLVVGLSYSATTINRAMLPQITDAELAADSVTASEIAAGAVGTSEVAADSLVAGDLAADSVEASEIATGAVTTTEILNGTILMADIAQNSATSGQVIKWNGSAWAAADDDSGAATTVGGDLTGTVGNAQIVANTVGTSEIATDGVDSAEIAASAVGTSEIADGTVAGVDLSSAGWTYGSQMATTSGTAVVLSAAIPTWAVEIEVILTGVSTSAANQPPLLQLGDAGGYETSGYIGEVSITQDANTNESAVTDGFSLTRATNSAAADLITGRIVCSRWDTAESQWVCSGAFITEGTMVHTVAGYKTTSQTTDSFRLTTTGGTATFDAGEARVRYR